MKLSNSYMLKSFVYFAFVLCLISCENDPNDVFSEVVKVSFRDVGHHLLVSNQDTTSLVKPVLTINNEKFKLAFENELEIHPDSLVNYIKNSFQKSELPEYYLVEVLQCSNNEVAYSYEVKKQVEKGIIPCAGRILKKGCYFITVRFTKMPKTTHINRNLLYLLILGVLTLLAVVIFKKKSKVNFLKDESDFASIGRFKFYPEQNKLVKEAIEISLSKKECELLAIFIAKPNQIIKRDELTKKVWEDNGVFVGRSLDTYISKLRKKLKEDTSVKLTNVHGIGYKLEIE
ncbi:winged helix-turn-helix domain-containing protein [Lutibacter sp.]|uniref:winged helix-turn-helix domain-containing protein n=1 Tax=Lutibacter sp. TaxID=1925666 RepID=UPI00349FE4DA